MTFIEKNTKVGEGNVDGTYTNSHNNSHSHNTTTHNTNSNNTTKNSNNKKNVFSIGGGLLLFFLGTGATVFINQGRLQVSPQKPSEQQKVNIESPTSKKQNLPSEVLSFTEGEVMILNYGNNQKKVLINARQPYSSTGIGLNNLIIEDIPLSQYQSGLIKLNKSSQIRGTLYRFNSESKVNNQYKLNTDGTDLTLQLNKNPIKEGELVKGSLSGIVTNGVDKEKVSLQLVLPVAR